MPICTQKWLLKGEWVHEELFIRPLSKRENEVLHLRSFGMGIKDIADHLGVSLQTVKHHSKNVQRKFNETDASMHRIIAECFRTGYLDPFEEDK